MKRKSFAVTAALIVSVIPLAARSRSKRSWRYAASLPSLSELLEVRYVDGSLPYGRARRTRTAV